MRAVITGASSGIGLEFANILHEKGYSLTLIARRKERLEKLKEKFGCDTEIITADLSKREEALSVFSKAYTDDTEILINNAGFGLCGSFLETDLSKELEMIDTNVSALHILTKLFVCKFSEKNSGYILNVASIAAFLPGPLLGTYYSTKAYVRVLTESIAAELKENKSNVHICTLCPGPVKTEFDSVANVKFSLKGADAHSVAEYAIRKMFRKKLYIFPGFYIRATVFFARFLPVKLLSKITYRMQKKKIGNR
mgnify:CR=1 FL=1